MMNIMVEAIVIAFCIGGAVGAMVAMQLQLGAHKHSTIKIDQSRGQK